VKLQAHPRRTLGIALALAILLAAPATAWARNGLDLAFQLKGSNGYRITVGGEGATAFVSAGRPGATPQSGKAWSTYIARGQVSPTAIKASFGDLGKVAMHFRPSGEVLHSKPGQHCRGADRYTIRLGVFVGSARFRGEGGYTSASAHRVKGKVVTPSALRCARPPGAAGHRDGSHTPPRHKRPQRTTLIAHWHSGVTAIFFAAVADRSKTRFLAATERTEGALAIYRAAFRVAPPSAFASDNTLSFAAVNPPAPFSGHGSLQRDSDGSRLWTGSLAVSFPGEPDVPLTGAQFKTQLVSGWSGSG
jgi:hypothetical protein